VLAGVVILGRAPLLHADPPAKTTTITIPDMDCPTCAKSVVGHLKQVAGVANVQVDLKATVAIVMAQPGRRASPRALWEAVEKAGHQPSRLQGPDGTFTTKPKS
jgi:Cu+-exporting ATPase